MKDNNWQKKRYLELIAVDYLIFIDASVAMCEGFMTFSDRIFQIKDTLGVKKIMVPEMEWNDLKRIAKKGSEEKRLLANKSVEKLNDMAVHHIAGVIHGGKEYEKVFENLHRDFKICILTQSFQIAEKLSKNPILMEFKAFHVRRLDRGGFIAPFYSAEQVFKFENMKRKIVIMPNMSLKVFRAPKEGEFIFGEDGGRNIQLGKEKKKTSDGIIYEVKTNGILECEVYAKIYKESQLDMFHYEKCKQMMTMKIKEKGICWPLQLLYDSQHKFVGYIFQKYNGIEISLGVMKKAGLDKYFSTWKKKELVQLTITLLQQIQYLQWNNILMGCPDLTSIYVETPEKIYLTEMDKYQIEGFPCLVRNNLFIPPEHMDFREKIFLFNDTMENYAVSVLCFMLMLPGKAPYSQKYGGNNIRNIKNMDFPYAYGEKHSRGRLSGFWRFVWSHLYYKLKREFFYTFSKGESRNAPFDRHDIAFWLMLLQEYNRELESGRYCQKDSYSELLFPKTFRKSDKETYMVCQHCGEEFPVWFMDKEYKTICKSCINKMSDSSFVCIDCGKRYYYSILEKLRFEKNTDWVPQKRCKECKKYRGNRGDR